MRANLSHMEIQISNLIQARKDSKEIADILGVSVNTLSTRLHLRTKLGSKKEKVTLKSHLKSIVFLVIYHHQLLTFFSASRPLQTMTI